MDLYTPWIVIFFFLTILLIISSVLGYVGWSYIAITSLFLLVSTIIFTLFGNQKKPISKEPEKDEIFTQLSTQKQIKDEEDEEDEEVLDEQEVVQEIEENQKRVTKSEEHKVNNQTHRYNINGPTNLNSESEDSDMEWLYSGYFEQNREWSEDGSISDEESLFEIDLPKGHLVYPKQAFSSSEKAFNYQPKLMELLAEINEINEEENMIEIDLTMGSIKCSRFEIETSSV